MQNVIQKKFRAMQLLGWKYDGFYNDNPQFQIHVLPEIHKKNHKLLLKNLIYKRISHLVLLTLFKIFCDYPHYKAQCK